MKCRFVMVAVVLSATMLSGAGVRGQEAEAPLRRSLTVEQAAIYDVRPAARPPAPHGDALQVVAWVDRPDYTYAIGEQVRLFVETNQDAYVAILNTAPDGSTTVLFPNRYQPDSFLRAGQAVEVPDPASRVRIAVNQPVGTELLKVMASTTPFSVREALQLGETGAFPEVRTSARATARSLTVVMAGDTAEPEATPVLADTDGRVTAPAVGRPQGASGAPVGATVTEAASGTAWAVCHQALTTISVPATQAARLSRSLTVENRRTETSGASARCEEIP